VARNSTLAFLSDEAIEGFRRWSEHHGVSRTSLIEAFGRFLDEHEPAATHRLSTAAMIRTAREVNDERKARPQK
jgi:hypothetical protein